MRSGRVGISALTPSRIPACEGIVASTDPWKRLGEHVDFRDALGKNDPRSRAFVCTVGEETAGFVLFSPVPVFARGGYLRAIGVSPAFRRLGVGRLLLRHAERVTARSADNLYLCVSSFNRRAQAFYRSCGYVRIGSIPGLIAPRSAEHIYWKRLRRSDGSRRRKERA